MRTTTACAFLVFQLTTAAFADQADAATAPKPPGFPPHVIANSELRILPGTTGDRRYQLHVGLPGSYAKETSRSYPVVYVTDAYWDFVKIEAIRGGLVYDKVVPEFIVVGLGYVGENLDYGDLRRRELSPVPFGGGGPSASGQAAEFHALLEKSIIPFIEREYRAKSDSRVLAGASLGGLFTLYSMYTKPELFSAYIAATPAIVLGNDWLLGYEEAFAKAGKRLPVRLFVSGGGHESPGFLDGIKRYDERVRSRKHEGLAYEFRIIEGERHAGMQFESYVRGLRFAFAPLAPETGPAR